MTKARTVLGLVDQYGPCGDARDWLLSYGRGFSDFGRAYRECPKYQWLDWILGCVEWDEYWACGGELSSDCQIKMLRAAAWNDAAAARRKALEVVLTTYEPLVEFANKAGADAYRKVLPWKLVRRHLVKSPKFGRLFRPRKVKK